MKKLATIFITHRYAIIWTICYVLIIKLILISLFNFDMFSSAAWIRLSHSRLHGFGGMVFGILMLAALPMYAATTSIIIRTKKPLIQIPVPKFITRAFAPPAPPAQKETEEEETKQAPVPTPETFPAEMPTELHAAFARARRNGSIRQTTSAFDSARISAAIPQLQPATTPPTDMSDFPLPIDFDTSNDEPESESAFPTFTDISFDNTPATNTTTDADDNSVTKLFGDDARPDGELVIYKDKLIATHDDPDFWIADETDWFASGKQRPSPITPLKQRAAELGLTPVLYLAQTNILDLDARIAAWESDGVRVIKDLSDLSD